MNKKKKSLEDVLTQDEDLDDMVEITDMVISELEKDDEEDEYFEFS